VALLLSFNELIQVVFITLLPYLELRGSIPYAILYLQMNPFDAFLISVITNILLIIPTFFLLHLFFHFFERISFVKKSLEKIHSKSKELVERYGFIGLMVFVAVPLPGTGAYAGSLAAYLLDMPRKKAFLAISLGVIIAGILVLAATLSANSLLSVFLAKV
jgi:uncharacterized membrane protein